MNKADRDELRNKIVGPVYPIITPFEETGEIDFVSLSSYVEFLIVNGASTILTTVGTSRFNLLSEAEIKTVNKTVAEAAAGRITTILAGPQVGSLQANIEFAQHAEAAGASAYIAFYPERWYSDKDIINFFTALAESVSIGIMIHEMPLRSGFGGTLQYSLELLEKLVEIDGVIGMKEECMDAGYAYKLHRKLAGRCGIIGAGAMRNYLRDYHAGAVANLVGIGSFFPRVEETFHTAMREGDIEKAHAIVRKYEDPYFDHAVAFGWHTQLKEILSYFDLMKPYERAPLSRIDPKEQQLLNNLINKLGWSELDAAHQPEVD